MANVDCAELSSAEERRRCEQRHARLMFGVAYPLCLAVAAVQRVMPGSRRDAQGLGGRRSVFKEARNAAASCIPFAFR